MNADQPLSARRKQGFAAMSREEQRAIASKGGKRAHELGKAHVWNSETAAEAGRKGGIVSRGGRGRAPSSSQE